jgi:hypothetical protein
MMTISLFFYVTGHHGRFMMTSFSVFLRRRAPWALPDDLFLWFFTSAGTMGAS